MLEVKRVYAGYGKDMVLNGVCMRAKAGEITTILGRNGCGKSTLLKTLIGLLPVKAGEISIDGETGLSLAQTAKRIAYLSQSKNVPEITAGRFVLHGRFPYLTYPRRYSENDHKIAHLAMEQMGIEALWDTPLSELSGGMRQKVYIAMALAKEAPVILMDEPTTYLDIGQQRLFSKAVRELAQNGKMIVLVLHDILLALKLSDRICVMENGVVVKNGMPQDILQCGILQTMYDLEIGMAETENGIQYYYK